MSAGGRPGRFAEITSTANPLVKGLKALALKRHREESGQFLAEGLKLVTDAAEGGWHADVLVYARSMTANRQFMDFAARLRNRGTDILEVSEKVLGSIARRDNPQMVLGVFRQRWAEPAVLEAMLENPGDLVIALDRVRDPGNLGTIIRAGDAAGARAVILVGETTDPYSIEAVRATMGSVFNLPLARMREDEFIAWSAKVRSKTGARMVGTHLEGAVDYRTVPHGDAPAILLMGNEQQGLTPALARACTDLVFIPMAGRADSLNLAIATGVMLFEMRRSFLRMPEGGKGKA